MEQGTVPGMLFGAAWQGGGYFSGEHGTVLGMLLGLPGREVGIFRGSMARSLACF